MRRKAKDSRQFWAGDCETDPFKYQREPKPFIWGLYTGTSFYHFATAQEFVDFIKDQDVIIYFHNGGKFDLYFLLAFINLEEPVLIINGRLVVAKIGKAEIRDSWNILPIALDKFGTKLVIDYAKMEADARGQHMPEIIHYLRLDCVTLYNSVDKFEQDYGRHLTQAGAAMKQWTKISGLKPPRSNAGFFDRFSQYYYGGRVQCFQKGHVTGPLQVYDIRSAYPWAMLDEHPYDPEYVKIANPRNFTPASMVTLECVSNGALPWRDERGGFRFPDDNEARTYHVPGHEVLAGLETGTISRVKIIEAIDFTCKISFRDYILHFYEKRLKARLNNDLPQSIFCKLLMNSLYGKFCSNPDNYGNYMCVEFGDMTKYADDGYTFDGMIGPHALLRAPLEAHEKHYLNVATGASITSQVRAHLWRAICASDHPVYCDTDSLIARRADLPIGDNLGDWNHEGTADDAWIAGKKMYYLEGEFDGGATHKSASKGVNLRLSEIKRAATGERLTGAEALKLAATGEAVTFGAEPPTFSLKKAPYFQTRTIRAT